MSVGAASPTPVPAATLLVLRDGASGLEVLMTARHQEAGFASGAWVFPGGKVEADDATLRAQARGGAALDDDAFAHRAAAIRETFEEGGLLLASRGDSAELLSEAELQALRGRAGGDFPAFLRAHALVLRVDLLVPFARWITPTGRAKRFDAQFLIAPAPRDQIVRHDGREAVDAIWVRPQEAIARAAAGAAKIVFPTLMNLRKLARFGNVRDALTGAARETVVTVTPEQVRTPAGDVLRIPAEAGYDITEMPVAQIQRS